MEKMIEGLGKKLIWAGSFLLSLARPQLTRKQLMSIYKSMPAIGDPSSQFVYLVSHRMDRNTALAIIRGGYTPQTYVVELIRLGLFGYLGIDLTDQAAKILTKSGMWEGCEMRDWGPRRLELSIIGLRKILNNMKK